MAKSHTPLKPEVKKKNIRTIIRKTTVKITKPLFIILAYTGFWWGNLRDKDHLGDSGLDGRIIKK
jgi:hypothetical protein